MHTHAAPTPDQLHGIRDAYTSLARECDTRQDDCLCFPRPHKKPTLTDYLTFFHSITPELHQALTDREHRYLEAQHQTTY